MTELRESVTATTGVELPDPTTVFQRQRVEALLRIAGELRGYLRDAPRDDPQVAGLLRDCDTLEEVAHIINQPPVRLTGLGSPGSIPSNTVPKPER